MTTIDVEKQRKRLVGLLRELFQLDQPELDFGFYRIMHAKSEEIAKFLEDDLLAIIRGEFDELDKKDTESLYDAIEDARKQAERFGLRGEAIEKAEPVKEAKAAYDVARNPSVNEAYVYDHLYRFFERYYDNGDFMSLRYSARETEGKAAPYAIPYDGREVYLHWANRDQYYIKTSEYLTNCSFDIAQAEEFKTSNGQLFEGGALKVHFRLVSATEGEHNNNKENGQTERYFIIHKDEPVKMEAGESGHPELIIQFEYRADPEKNGQEGTWRKKRLDEAAAIIKQALPELDASGNYVTAPQTTAKDAERTLLDRYLLRYTSRNTMDYFIHKDLGGFLKRELDFYIKNEVMRLDDIETAEAPLVGQYLSRVKVLRRIARHLIDFLAQLENFQKKLWLKKKFVTETQYCITLDRIPEKFYDEIVASESQREEWVRLFAIDELEGYSKPLTMDFLKANPFLALDTAFFPTSFKEALLAEVQELDANISGVLIQSENFQALELMWKKYQSSIAVVYNDPPYNTSDETFIYKNSYKHSSWISMVVSNLSRTHDLLSDSGALIITIDDAELYNIKQAVDASWGSHAFIANIVVQTNPSGRDINSYFATSHDYALFFSKNPEKVIIQDQLLTKEQAEKFRFQDEISRYKLLPFRRSGGLSTPEERSNSEFCLYVHRDEERIVAVGGERTASYPAEYETASVFIWDPEVSKAKEINIEDFKKQYEGQYIEVMPIDKDGDRRVWRWSNRKKILEAAANGEFAVKKTNGSYLIQLKDRIREGRKPKTIWHDSKYDGSSHGTNLLKSIMGERRLFGYPKSLHATKDALHCLVGNDPKALILDCFGGSATTAHAVMSLNRDDHGNRKFLIVEMGTYFDLVTKPRCLKVAYSMEWSEGKPISRDGISHVIKYIRLESYEDTLNSLAFRNTVPIGSDSGSEQDFKRDFMLHYWLDFETKGSPSLLNIEKFDNPTAYTLKVKKPGTDEYNEQAVDLIETFNWLIGLHVTCMDCWRSYDAKFKREKDPELPEDTDTRLILRGGVKESDKGVWHLRKIEGYTLRKAGNNTDREHVLVIWRQLTGDLEKDNLILDEWFKQNCLSDQGCIFDTIYVNGSNNLLDLQQTKDRWNVHLIEESFHQAMWDVED